MKDIIRYQFRGASNIATSAFMYGIPLAVAYFLATDLYGFYGWTSVAIASAFAVGLPTAWILYAKSNIKSNGSEDKR